LCPAKEEITGGLHDTLPIHDPVGMARVDTGTEVTLKNRSLRLLDLQEERITTPVSLEESNITTRAHTSYPDDLLDNINEVILPQQNGLDPILDG
jgi:hypothetical protein